MNDEEFVFAAQKGDAQVVRQLLERHAQETHTEELATTLWAGLLWAAHNGNVEIVKMLRTRGHAKRADLGGNTALMWAARNGHAEAVKELIASGNLQQRDLAEGRTALEWAIEGKQWACVDWLAIEEPQMEALPWPVGATQVDLPQWFARKEQEILCQKLQQQGQGATEIEEASETKKRGFARTPSARRRL